MSTSMRKYPHHVTGHRPYAVRQDFNGAKISASLEVVIEASLPAHEELLAQHHAGSLSGEAVLDEHLRDVVVYETIAVSRQGKKAVVLRMKEISRRPLLAILELEDEERQKP